MIGRAPAEIRWIVGLMGERVVIVAKSGEAVASRGSDRI
jgi:hypothetical protein